MDIFTHAMTVKYICRCKYNDFSSNFHLLYTKKSKKNINFIAISKNICTFATKLNLLSRNPSET